MEKPFRLFPFRRTYNRKSALKKNKPINEKKKKTPQTRLPPLQDPKKLLLIKSAIIFVPGYTPPTHVDTGSSQPDHFDRPGLLHALGLIGLSRARACSSRLTSASVCLVPEHAIHKKKLKDIKRRHKPVKLPNGSKSAFGSPFPALTTGLNGGTGFPHSHGCILNSSLESNSRTRNPSFVPEHE